MRTSPIDKPRVASAGPTGGVVETPRLRIRNLRDDDLTDLVALIDNWEVARWVSAVPNPYTEADGRRWIALVRQDHATGRPRRFAIALKMTDRLIGGLIPKGYHIVSPRSGEQWSGIVSFTSPKHDHEQLVKSLRKDKKIEIALREGRLRASPHFYNTEQQIDRLIEALPGN